MKTTRSDIRVRAPKDVVWRVVTEPEYVAQWQYGSILSTDWKVGSPIRFSSDWQGQHFEQWGTVLTVEEPDQIRYSLFAPRPGLEDSPENYFTMIYELTDEDGATLLTFIQEDPREAPLDTGEESSERDNPVLRIVKELAESLADSESEY